MSAARLSLWAFQGFVSFQLWLMWHLWPHAMLIPAIAITALVRAWVWMVTRPVREPRPAPRPVLLTDVAGSLTLDAPAKDGTS